MTFLSRSLTHNMARTLAPTLLHGLLMASVVALSLPVQAADQNAATQQEYTLDMRGADILEFINTIAKLTGKTIVVDQKVRGKVDIQSPRNLTPEELYEVFLVQLSVNGYAVVDTGNGILKVIPAQGAKLEGIALQNNAIKASEEIISRVVRVENVNANQLVATLRPLVNNKTGIIAGYDTSNVILITDRASNVRRLVQIISQVDKADSQTLELIPLKNASASELQRILANLNKPAQKGKSASSVLISADNRTNTLIIRADDNERRRLRRIVTALDSNVESNSNTKVHYLKYAKAEDLVKVLQSVSDAMLKDEEQKQGKDSKANRNSSINIDGHEATNSVILSGSPHLIKSLEDVIRKLDIRRAQVLVEAIIVELTETKAKDLGVQWLFRGDPTSGDVPLGVVNFRNNSTGIIDVLGAQQSGNVANSVGAIRNGATLGFGNIDSNGFSFAALVQALATDSESNVLSTPSLMTLDNEEASILVGQEVPIITGSTASSNNTNPFQTIQRKDIGVKLTVTPQINEGNAVALAIEQEVSSLSGRTEADIITNKRIVNTTVLVDDGSTIVLGGLIDEDVQESTSKVPLLGDIPYLGRAFRSDNSQKVKRNLMIFIRPTIIRDRSAIASVSREKYNYMHARQLAQQEEGIKLFPELPVPQLPQWPAQQLNPDRPKPAEPDYIFPNLDR